MDDTEQAGEFKVRDKRRFTPEGESKAAQEQSEKEPTGPTAEKEQAPPEQEQPDEKAKAAAEPLPPMNFQTFVYSLASQLLFQLGLIAVPGEEPTKDFEGALRTVDVILLIEEKTKGNLSDEEQKAMRETWFIVVSKSVNHAYSLLGIADTKDAKPKKDLPAARELIDFIGSLEEKTRGKLTNQEQKFISETLFQLRMAFVEASK
jgi:hypothetical protein